MLIAEQGLALLAALTSETIISPPCAFLSSYPQLFPAGYKVIAQPAPVKVEEKLATKSSPVKVGQKRKAPDETPCQAKVRVRITVHPGRSGRGPCVPNPLHLNLEMS